jgi:hypothetical protein
MASVLPATRENEHFTLLVIVGVTLLSTVAMVINPRSPSCWSGATCLPASS